MTNISAFITERLILIFLPQRDAMCCMSTTILGYSFGAMNFSSAYWKQLLTGSCLSPLDSSIIYRSCQRLFIPTIWVFFFQKRLFLISHGFIMFTMYCTFGFLIRFKETVNTRVWHTSCPLLCLKNNLWISMFPHVLSLNQINKIIRLRQDHKHGTSIFQHYIFTKVYIFALTKTEKNPFLFTILSS